MTPVELVGDYLNSYLFDNIWNEPCREYRRNIIPIMLGTRAYVSTIQLRSVIINLPGKNAGTGYYVYSVPRVYQGVTIDVPSWQPLATWLNLSDLIIRVHGNDGEMLYRNKIYITNHPTENAILMAIDTKMFHQILGNFYDPADIYFSLYYDSDTANTIQIGSSIPTDRQSRSTLITNLFAIDPDTIFINGRESVLRYKEHPSDKSFKKLTFNDLKDGDYVEWIVDKNIIGSFNLDLSVDSQNRRFYSTLDPDHPCYKNIVHIPKIINPNNILLTHNTCDIYIRPRNIKNKFLKGLYMHRCHDDKGVTQLTHNDFTIPEAIIDAYKAALNTTEVVLHVVVRTHHSDPSHPRPNYLVRDSHYIYLLYEHNDTDILDFMEGAGKADIPFWKAQELEKNEYVKMMFDTPDDISRISIDRAIDALGYHQTLSLVCGRIVHYKLVGSIQRRFEVPIPMLYIEKRIGILCYINGIKIDDNLVTLERQLNGYTDAVIADSVDLQVNDLVSFELFEYEQESPVFFVPTSVDPSVVLVDIDYKVYEVANVNTVTSINTEVVNGPSSFSKSFKLVTDTNSVYTRVDNGDGTFTAVFNDAYFNKGFIFVGQHRFIKVVDREINVEETTSIKSDTRNLISVNQVRQTYIKPSENTSFLWPAVDVNSYRVYLNGRTLAKDVDYRVYRRTDTSGNFMFDEIIIQSANYFDNNLATISDYGKLEVYITDDVAYNDMFGFVYGGQIGTADTSPYWLEDISLLTVDGLVVGKYEDLSGKLVVDLREDEGCIYNIVTTLSKEALEALTDHGMAEDTERMITLSNYFSSMEEAGPDISVIENTHKLYSVVTNQLIMDVLSGKKQLYYEADDSRILEQVAEYMYLKAYDVLFALDQTTGEWVFSPAMDLRYIDALPTYRLGESYDPVTYSALIRILEAILPPDQVKIWRYTK